MSQVRTLDSISNANFPTDDQGRVYHLAVKRGEVANRVISVGDPKRAQLLASLLDNPEKNFIVSSKRGFVIYTGRKNNVPVSVIATGMGFPMIDFVVRETRAIVEGPMAFIRLGTCGTPTNDIPIGNVMVATKGSLSLRRNPDAFEPGSTAEPYDVSKPVLPDAQLSQLVIACLKENLKSGGVSEGLNCTADSFYSSQGRIDPAFDDRNKTLIEDLSAKHNVSSLEMETFHLFDLARCSFGSIKASAAAIVLAQRKTNAFLDMDTLHKLEREAGEAVLCAITKLDLSGKIMDDTECVWNKSS